MNLSARMEEFVPIQMLTVLVLQNGLVTDVIQVLVQLLECNH